MLLQTALIPAVRFTDDEYDIDRSLEARMSHYGVTAVSVAVLQNGELANLEVQGTVSSQDATEITIDTLFQAASISKPVSAIGLMTLVDRNIVELDAPVNQYLTSWRLPGSHLTQDDPVTLRELLSHSAGVSVPSYPAFERGAELPTLDDILDGSEKAYSNPVEVISQQGHYRYSGGGYMVIQKLIEDQSGQSFEDFMQRQVFAPASMALSTFAHPDPATVALGHHWNGDQLAGGWREYPQSAAAGLWTTPADLAKLLLVFYRAYKNFSTEIISQNSAEMMATAVVDNTGLGFGVHGSDADLHISHAGWNTGYRSSLLFFPESGNGIVVMANGQGGNDLADEIIRSAVKLYGWPSVLAPKQVSRQLWSEEKQRAVTGRYQFTQAGFSIMLRTNGQHFVLETPRGSVYQAYPIEDNRLVILETGEFIDIETSNDGITLELWGMTAVRH